MPVFEQHLERTFAHHDLTWTAAVMANYQEMFGGALTGALGLRQFAVLLIDRGMGSTGKSTTLEFLQCMVPAEFRCSVSPMDWGEPYYMAALAGKHLNLVGELSNQTTIPASEFKNVTGHDPVSARHVYERPFEFVCETSHVLASNHFIPTRDHTNAFFRRWRIIPFENPIAAGERQEHFASKVWEAEAPQILAWALEGAVRFVNDGFSESPGHDAYLRRWRITTDSVRHFFTDPDAIGITESKPPTGWLQRSDVYRIYKDWCQDYGMKPVSASNFYENIDAGRIDGLRLIKGDKGTRYVHGAVMPGPNLHAVAPGRPATTIFSKK
jgi:putative DNA primase/helicase